MKQVVSTLLAALLLTGLLTACGKRQPPGAPSSQKAPPFSYSAPIDGNTGGVKKHYLNNISYDIPANWMDERVVQGYYYTAPDDGLCYTTISYFAPLNLEEPEHADDAIAVTAGHLQDQMPDYIESRRTATTFKGRQAMEIWFTIEIENKQRATLLALLFTDRNEVYTFVFAVTFPDVKEAMPEILDSVYIAETD